MINRYGEGSGTLPCVTRHGMLHAAMNIALYSVWSRRLCAKEYIGKAIQAVANYGCLAGRKTVKLADISRVTVTHPEAGDRP